MSVVGYVGQYYQVTSTSITLHGVPGFYSGSEWVVGIPLDDTYSCYVPCAVEPVSVSLFVERLIAAYVNGGKASCIAAIHMTTRIAVRLFLERVLCVSHFVNASEEENKVVVPGVLLGGLPYTLVIWPERLLNYEFIPVDDRGLILDLD